MEFWLCVIGIAIVCICFPYIRYLFKRLNCLFKIKRVCRTKGYRLQGIHHFWFLGGNQRKTFDCTIETAEELVVIKLFGVVRRKRVLVFTDSRKYFTRALSGILLWFVESFDSSAKPIPEYAFECNESANGKKVRKILLVNPVPLDMQVKGEQDKAGNAGSAGIDKILQAENRKETTISPGDTIYGMEVANLSRILNLVIS